MQFLAGIGLFAHFQTMASLLTVQGKHPCIDFAENDNLVLAADGCADPERPVAGLLLHV